MLIHSMLLATFIITFSGSVLTQQLTHDGAEVTLRNGVHLRLETRQTAQSGSVFLGELVLNPPDVVHRLFADAQNHLRFGYDIDAIAAGQTGEITIELKPLDASASHNDGGLGAKAKLLTLEKRREIGPMRVGEKASVDLFVDESTGNKITDVIEVFATGESDRSKAEFDETQLNRHPESPFELSDVRVWLNGTEITGRQPLRSISGRYPVLYIPGHGSFFLALEAVDNLPFVQAGIVTFSKLRFTIGTDSIECTSRVPILADQGPARLWVWHDAKYRPSVPEFNRFVGEPDRNGLQIAVADSMEVWRNMVFERRRSF